VYCSEVNKKLVLAYQLKGEKGRRVGEGEDMGKIISSTKVN